MKKTVLLTLGRLPKALEVARCLYAAGCRVIIADPLNNHLSKPSRAVDRSIKVTAPNENLEAFLDDLHQIIQDENVDLVLPVSEEAIYVSGLAARMAETARLLCAPTEHLMLLHDKLRFNEMARGFGLNAPETCLIGDERARDLMARKDYVIKPVHGCSGRGVSFHRAGETDGMDAASSACLVQERIRGQELSTLTFAHEGRAVGTIVYKGLLFAGTVAICFERVDSAPEIETWVDRFVERAEYSGFIAFDFIQDECGAVWPLECNPRLTSGVHFMDHEDLAACILGAPPAHGIRAKTEQRYQEGHTVLTEAYARILRPREFARHIGTMARTRDVLWSPDDPAPFFLMTPMSWAILKKVLFEKASFGEAATGDIEWRPDEGSNAHPAGRA